MEKDKRMTEKVGTTLTARERASEVALHIIRHFGLLPSDGQWIEDRLRNFGEQAEREAVEKAREAARCTATHYSDATYSAGYKAGFTSGYTSGAEADRVVLLEAFKPNGENVKLGIRSILSVLRNLPLPSDTTDSSNTTASKEQCAHINEHEWNNCPKPHVEPEGMAWRKAKGEDVQKDS